MNGLAADAWHRVLRAWAEPPLKRTVGLPRFAASAPWLETHPLALAGDKMREEGPMPLSAPIRETASVIGYSANQARIAKRTQTATIIDVRRLEKE